MKAVVSFDEDAASTERLPGYATPVDPMERRRNLRRRAAKRWIEPLVLGWLVTHGVPWLLAYGFREEIGELERSQQLFLLWVLAGSQVVALVFAGASAAITMWNGSLLSRGWIIAGLLPWTVFVAEITSPFVVMWF